MIVARIPAITVPSHSSWYTGSSRSIGTAPKPLRPPRSCGLTVTEGSVVSDYARFHRERSSMAVATSTVTRSFVHVPAGTIHVAQSGTGKPVLLLHQTPRSWDEYRDVVPLLGENFHAIAMDTIGFGDSSKPGGDGPDTIEMWAEVAVSVLDALGIQKASIVGHHTGAVIAMEIAASFPDRVDKLILSAPAFVDDEHRRLYGDKPPVDEVERKLDGSHLVGRCRCRRPSSRRALD